MSTQAEKFEPFWLDEKDWLVTLAMVDLKDEKDKVECAQVIGYLVAYAFLTNTRYLAVVGDPRMVTYELLFSFDTPEDKGRFLQLVNGNEITRMEPFEWMVPSRGEISRAKPIGLVIPEDIMELAILIAASVIHGDVG